jgi:plasmid stabilization system protein ParE
VPESGKPLRVVLAPSAQRDIRETLKWSLGKFGPRAAVRYRDLLKQALRDVTADPERPGSRERPELARGFEHIISSSAAIGPNAALRLSEDRDISSSTAAATK